VFTAFSRAFSQVLDPTFRKVFWRGLILTSLVFVGVGWLVYVLTPALTATPWDWLNAVLDYSAIVVFTLLAFIMFPALATLFIGLFLDDVAEAVEQRHYPGDQPGRALPMGVALAVTLRFTLLVIVLNILVLPLYVVVIWFPPINMLIFYSLNGYLLGREYFELVARRHAPEPDVATLRKRNGMRVFLPGVVITFLLTIPFVNLLAPMVATAAMVHVFKRLAEREQAYRRAVP